MEEQQNRSDSRRHDMVWDQHWHQQWEGDLDENMSCRSAVLFSVYLRAIIWISVAVAVATECELNRKKCEQGSSQRRDEEEKTIKHRLGLGTCELQTGCVINGDCLCKHQM